MPNSQSSLVHKAEKEKWEVEACQHKQLDSVFLQEATHKRKGIGYQLNETNHRKKNADEFHPSNAANLERTDSNEQQLKIKQEEEEELLAVKDSRNDSMVWPLTTQDREKAVNACMMFEPNNPCFAKIMHPYNVHKSFIVNVPAAFAKKYLHGVSDSFQLEVSGGEQWPVHCKQVNGVVKVLAGGWSRFAKDNNLAEGDVCVFELIQVEDVVLKVSIFRARDTRQINLPNLKM